MPDIQPPDVTDSPVTGGAALRVGSRVLPLRVVRHRRARRYVLRLTGNHEVRVTVPRSGTIRAATEFALRHTAWLERQLARVDSRRPAPWQVGSTILFRGDPASLLPGPAAASVTLVDQVIPVDPTATDLRPGVERHLWNLAARELPPRVRELAAHHGIAITRVQVRNQRSRWGSCSRSGTISLNWRLIQAPASVRDYLILHELMHRREMNHSDRFWRAVAAVCPAWATAEHWLKTHSRTLR